jgi:hypothetical protein
MAFRRGTFPAPAAGRGSRCALSRRRSFVAQSMRFAR